MAGADRIAAVRPAVERELASRPDVAAAFLAGSLVDGFGNENSDVDILVLTHEPPPTPDPAGGGPERRSLRFDDTLIELVFLDAERLDIETRAIEVVRDTVRRLGGLTPDRDAHHALTEFECQFLHQMRIGIPVAGEALLTGLRAEVDWGRLATLLRLRAEESYVGHAEDAAGAVHAGDAATAMLMSRWALGSAIDCVTAGLGHTNTKQKWRYRKLAQLGRDDLIARCLSVECDADCSPESLLRGARRRLVAAQDLVAIGARAGAP